MQEIKNGIDRTHLNSNSVFRTHKETLVLTWKNCIDIVGNQRTIVCTVLMDELLFINGDFYKLNP